MDAPTRPIDDALLGIYRHIVECGYYDEALAVDLKHRAADRRPVAPTKKPALLADLRLLALEKGLVTVLETDRWTPRLAAFDR